MIEWLKSHTWQTCNTFRTDVPAGFCVKYTSRWLYKKEKHTHLSIISSFPRIRIFHYSKPVLPLWFRSLLSQFRMKHCPLPEQSNGFYMIRFEQKIFTEKEVLNWIISALTTILDLLKWGKSREKKRKFFYTYIHAWCESVYLNYLCSCIDYTIPGILNFRIYEQGIAWIIIQFAYIKQFTIYIYWIS